MNLHVCAAHRNHERFNMAPSSFRASMTFIWFPEDSIGPRASGEGTNGVL